MRSTSGGGGGGGGKGGNQTNTLSRVFTSCGRHIGSGSARCSVTTVGTFEYAKSNSRNGNKEELYFTLL